MNEFEKIELKNVLVKGSTPENIVVQVVPFDCYNDEHVEFAYAYTDMLYRAPSPFKSVSDVAKAYVKLFMVHTEADEKIQDSTFSKVYNDLRAARTLFQQDSINIALNSFFENA